MNDCRRIHFWLIQFFGLIVPRRLRADWRQEWEAELRFREILLSEWDKLDTLHKFDLWRRSIGACWDALLLQPQRWEDDMIQDLRYGVRMLLKHKMFTAVAVLSLALGIGANTAIFSLFDAVLLKSLPVQEPERLVLFGKGEDIGLTNSFPSKSIDLYSYPFYQQIRQQRDVFSDVGAVLSIPWNVHGKVNSSAETEQMSVQLVSGNYFSVLGVKASLGRTLSDEDDVNPGGHPVVVVSYGWWQRRLGADPSAIGKTITIDQTTYTIIGVGAKDFFGTTVGQSPNLWIPLAMEPQMPPTHWDGRANREFQDLNLIARLQNGVQMEQANAAVNARFKQHLQEWAGAQPSADQVRNIQQARVELTPAGRGLSELRQQFSVSLRVLMVVVGLVLLIACANIANLLLARATSRQKEFAVRMALGAGRMRIVRQLLTESLLLAALGGLAGVMLAWWGGQLLVLMASGGAEALPLDVTPNARILTFTLCVSLFSALLFGLAPALRALRLEPNASLKGGKGTVQAGAQSPFGKALVVGQVALSLVLLVGAGLFVRTLINLQNVPTGFNTENALLFRIDTAVTGYKDVQLAEVMRAVEEKVKVVPGVQAAAFSFIVFNQGLWTGPAYTQEQLALDVRSRIVRNNTVGADYFAAMGIPLVAGRGFTAQDNDKSQKVAVISETMAQRFFPNVSPIGRRFGIRGPESGGQIEVIGVVKDVRAMSLSEELRPSAYYPHAQGSGPLHNFVVRFVGAPENIVPQVRRAVREVNPSLPIDEVVSLSDHVGRSLVQQKLTARLGAFFGLLALLLACIGLYGVLSYAVARRTNEIGIRMALGAQSRNVLWLVLREALLLAGIGIGIGLIAAVALTRTAKTLLFGLQPNDPLTIALATALLFFVAVVAGYLPARRAARIDPMIALRDE
ncbi:MAG: ABC transporter permease [Blastocatellia bacterium]|nr:ABC transporter permease [Blastocatellia bacterium]